MTLNPNKLTKLASSLLNKAGYDSKVISAVPIYQGGNNQLFHIKNSQNDFVLKNYFCNTSDLRSRLENEYRFLEWASGVANIKIPAPLANDSTEGVALYEFIHGEKLKPSFPVARDHIGQAAEFIFHLNENFSSLPKDFQNASEACFSIQSHINKIDKRLNLLAESSSQKNEFRSVLVDVINAWKEVKGQIYRSCLQVKLQLDQELSSAEKIISPSDFGFHNALIQENHTVVFIDFEYAGIDDPAKLVCDFFNQVSIPVDNIFFPFFIDKAFRGRSDINSIATRSRILMQAYSIKWCCIVLSIFLDNNLERRIFSNPNLDTKILIDSQIAKARLILNRVAI